MLYIIGLVSWLCCLSLKFDCLSSLVIVCVVKKLGVMCLFVVFVVMVFMLFL